VENEREIGEFFSEGILNMKVVKSSKENRCDGCYYYNHFYINCKKYFNIGKCKGADRKDKNNVIFIEVKEQKL
jgi:hypothetical protein